MARPKKQLHDARTVRFNLRFSLHEWSAVEARAATAGLSPTEFCRQAVLGCRIEAAPFPVPVAPAPHPAGAAAATAQIVALNRVGVNLNQIARNLNGYQGFIPDDLADSLQRVNRLLDAWQGVAE